MEQDSSSKKKKWILLIVILFLLLLGVTILFFSLNKEKWDGKKASQESVRQEGSEGVEEERETYYKDENNVEKLVPGGLTVNPSEEGNTPSDDVIMIPGLSEPDEGDDETTNSSTGSDKKEDPAEEPNEDKKEDEAEKADPPREVTEVEKGDIEKEENEDDNQWGFIF
ncbi:MAG: hypothetical protein UHS49_05080 [Faecalimonas sp.]|nr:hypothetical protein [Faecalimonas sp.]